MRTKNKDVVELSEFNYSVINKMEIVYYDFLFKLKLIQFKTIQC